MRPTKEVLQSITGVPANLVSTILNAESDWIRYGLPAAVLTAIFFFVMRFESPSIELRPVSPSPVARKIAPRKATSLPVAPVTNAEPRRLPSNNSQPRMADAQAPKAVAVAPQVQPHTEVSSEQQKQGRKAICTAVAYAASRFKKKHRKEKAMEMALESYQGERGTQGADQAVAAAMEEYQRGAWDESLCSTTAFGGLTLPKGAIGAAMR